MENQLDIRRGSNIKVFQKIVEGKKERIIAFQGKVIKSRGTQDNRMLTVRQYIDGVDVDRIFPLNAPMIIKVEEVAEKKKRRKVASKKSA